MSLKRVDQKVTSASRDAQISKQEAKQIIKAAETTKTGKADVVSNSEAKKIGELYDNAFSMGGRPPPGATWNPPPITSDRPAMDKEARKEFNQFFIRHKLPYGENETNVKSQIKTLLDVIDRGEPLKKPPSTRSLHEIFMHDQRPVDGERLDAFYDASKARFFLKSTIQSRANPEGTPRWFGPFNMVHHTINPPHH